MVVDYNKSKANNAKNLEVRVTENECWEVISHCTDNAGYGQYKNQRAHIVMYKKHKGEIPKGMHVRHICDNKLCCNPKHLILGTHKDNMQDALERDRFNPKRKLNIEQVIQILEMLPNFTETEIANKYGIKRQTVNDIKHRRIWEKELEKVGIY